MRTAASYTYVHSTELPSAGVRGLALKRGHLWMVDVNGVRRALVLLEDICLDTCGRFFFDLPLVLVRKLTGPVLDNDMQTPPPSQ